MSSPALLRRFAHVAAVMASTTLSAACYHSTELAATWHEPNPQPLHFRKMIAVFVTKSETFRRTMEDKLAEQFPNTVQSYKVLKTTDVSDAADGAKIRQQLARDGFDGAIIMRVVNVDQRLTYTPGTYWYGPPYYTFAGYWGTAWGYPYDPGYLNEDVVVSIETQIYSLQNDKLIWAARSETTNPRSVSRLGDSVIKHVKEKLEKQGFLALARPRAPFEDSWTRG
jgi:hypothetical protein